MKTKQLLKKALLNVLRKSPETLDFVMDVCTEIILERAGEKLDMTLFEEEATAEKIGNELASMIFNN